MKFNSFFLYGALSAVAVAAIGWSVWSTKAVAQDVESPVVPADAVESDDASATEVLSGPVQSAQSRTNPYSQQPGTRIGLPGPPVYHDPNRGGVLLPLQAGTYSVQVRETDVEAAKRIEAYQKLQNDINKLLQQRYELKSDSQRSELRQQIVEATAKQFDLRQQLREREVEQLKKRLAEVESTVASRNKLKNEIVEKRVADILREPDELGWEPLGVTPGLSSANAQPISIAPRAPNQLLHADRVPRTVTQYVVETFEDVEGKKRQVVRGIPQITYVDPDAAPRSPLKPSTEVVRSARGYLSPAISDATVAEAEDMLRDIDTRRDLLLEQNFEKFEDVEWRTKQLESLQEERKLAALVLEKSKAEVKYTHARTALAAALNTNKFGPGSIDETILEGLRVLVEQAQAGRERAKTNLELHQRAISPRDHLREPPAEQD